MCRLAAYLGPEIPLKQFLLDPAHSLYVQSWQPRELRYAKLNADGFGIGWYDADGSPATYVNPMPIWSDVNLDALARSLSNDLWIASVRSATSGFASGAANTQPFCDDDLIFTHNGFIADFNRGLRSRALDFLSPDIATEIRGNTDSEYLFAVLRHLALENEDASLESLIGEALALVGDWADEREALLNLIVTDGERVYAARHAVNHDCPSLYYTTDDERFPDGAQLIASERLTEAEFWQPVPEHHLLILDPEQPPELLSL
jgi:glutamine amidotransferase